MEELTLVELATPQEAGELQITAVGDVASGVAGQVLAVAVELEFGLTDWLQISAGAPLTHLRPAPSGVSETGPGDAEVGALAALAPAEGALLALAVELQLPTGDADRGLGEGELAIEPSVRLALDLELAQLHGLFGLGLGDETELAYGAGLTIAATDDWVVSFEFAVEEAEGVRLARVVPAGLAWHGVEDVEVGLGVVLHAGDGPLHIGASARFVIEI